MLEGLRHWLLRQHPPHVAGPQPVPLSGVPPSLFEGVVQMPLWHACPLPQTAHTRPAVPQASALFPGKHPSWPQHPVAQVSMLHSVLVDGGAAAHTPDSQICTTAAGVARVAPRATRRVAGADLTGSAGITAAIAVGRRAARPARAPAAGEPDGRAHHDPTQENRTKTGHDERLPHAAAP